MRPPYLPLLAILTQFAALISASPPLPRALLPRSQHCANAPSTIAGTFLHPRTPPTPRTPLSRTNGLVWCATGSSTFIIVSTYDILPAMRASIPDMLIAAAGMLLAQVQIRGDGVIPALPGGGIFQWMGEHALALEVANANNHQTTYGVLAAALLALAKYMIESGDASRASFDVYDGPNCVGTGWVG